MARTADASPNLSGSGSVQHRQLNIQGPPAHGGLFRRARRGDGHEIPFAMGAGQAKENFSQPPAADPRRSVFCQSSRASCTPLPSDLGSAHQDGCDSSTARPSGLCYPTVNEHPPVHIDWCSETRAPMGRPLRRLRIPLHEAPGSIARTFTDELQGVERFPFTPLGPITSPTSNIGRSQFASGHEE